MRDMFAVSRILAAFAFWAAAFMAVTNVVPRSDPPLVDTASSITVHRADPRWVADIDADLALFEHAGLGAVPVDIHVWDSARIERCHGFAGLFTPTDPRARVDLCLDFHHSELGTHLRHKAILHELAHAWIHGHTSESQRRGFMALRGIDGWNDPETTHSGRGAEVAANAIVTMLHPDEPASSQRICGYELLTGRDSPGDRHDPCGRHATRIRPSDAGGDV